MDDVLRYKLLKLLSNKPAMSQRAMATSLGLSLGKINYALKALIEKGFIKAEEFYNSDNKRAYSYILTPEGIEEKANVTLRYFKRKMKEYEQLQKELEYLKNEVRIIENGTTANGKDE
ncbi:MAG: MarR family EPS-associated transcriptional regulator [Thermodesulfobacteria bacterium]|nr:MarR family EPS-associated transcriptional regulator [Thermodesulfobacteriota bacterium]